MFHCPMNPNTVAIYGLRVGPASDKMPDPYERERIIDSPLSRCFASYISGGSIAKILALNLGPSPVSA